MALEQTICLAGGCFWGVQHYFDCLPGVLRTEVGYANGRTDAPSYEQVRYEGTGHAETVRVTFDDARQPLGALLERFFAIIDPTAVDRQGGDIGHQYRTGIYYTDETQRAVAAAALAALQTKYDRPLAVELCALESFWPAEEYHQKYLEKNPGGYCHIPLRMFEQARRG